MRVRNALIYQIVFIGICLSPLQATEIMSPATQLGSKRLHGEVYYRHMADQELEINVGARSPLRVGNSTITATSNTELESQGSGNGVMGKLTFQPFESGLQYYVLGGVSTYDLKIPSGSYSNSYGTDNPGYVVGGGIKYTLVPYTMVTPALSLEFSATHSRYQLTKFISGDGKVISDSSNRLTLFEIQGALMASKKFIFDIGSVKASIDPYLGVKVSRTRAEFDELSTGANFSGTRVGVSPFFGFKFKPFPYEGIVVEGSVLNETSASVGLTFGF